MIIEIKDGEKIVSTREVQIKELNLKERGQFLDLLYETQIKPSEKYFTRIFDICRICTDYTDSELNEFSTAELVQLFNAIVQEKADTKKKQ